MASRAQFQENNATKRAQGNYPAPAPRNPGCTALIEGLRALAPNNSNAQVLDVFDGRASLSAIRHWQARRRGVPQWALDLICEKLAKRAAPYLAAAALARSVPPGPGMGWNKHGLNAWRAKQAALKEKARD